MINARIDVFLADAGSRPQGELVDDAVGRANAYLAAGADCVYPILLHDERAIASFIAAVEGPVNILALPGAPSPARMAELHVARISYGSLIHTRAMLDLERLLADIASA